MAGTEYVYRAILNLKSGIKYDVWVTKEEAKSILMRTVGAQKHDPVLVTFEFGVLMIASGELLTCEVLPNPFLTN